MIDVIPYYRLKRKTGSKSPPKVPMGFSIEMHRHTDADGEWGRITVGGDQYWADPVVANEKFMTVLSLVRTNIRANWDLRLIRSGTVVNQVRTRSHYKM